MTVRAILTYHSVDASGSPISVDPESFRRHVRWLASDAVEVVPLDRVATVDPGANTVAVTFDDALVSVGGVAAPQLLDAGIPFTIFVVSDRVGGSNDWWDPTGGAVPRLELMDWDELGRLAERGVGLGSHTRTHPDLTTLPEGAVEEEMAGCINRIQGATGVRPRAFAYPYGAHDAASVSAARRHFDLACTAELRTLDATADAHRLPRLDMVYFQGSRWLDAWGRADLRMYIWLRRTARSVRARMATLGS